VVTAHVYITGKVQGVFFRASLQRQAQNLRVKGWVKNLPDGRVEALFSGPEAVVKQMISWCRQGPKKAKVEDVEVVWEKPEKEFSNFVIER